MKIVTNFFKISIGLFICFSAPWLYSADRIYGFKDIELGSGISEIIDDQSFSCETVNSTIADKTCQLTNEDELQETIDKVPISSLTLHYFSDKLATIVIIFEEKSFEPVIDSLRQEYGPPTRRYFETYVSPMYELFEGLVCVWKNDVSTIEAIQYFSNTDDSAVLYKYSAYIDKLTR